MEILLFAEPRLEGWLQRPPSPGVLEGPRAGDARDEYRAEVAREPPGPPVAGGPFSRVAEAICGYRIFEPRRIRGVLARRPVEVGDVVGIEFRVAGPLRLFFAAQVTERFDEVVGGTHRAGFRYRTLRGHPELGEETFAVEKSLADGRVAVSLASWSRPGTLLARLGAPIVRRLQIAASHGALRHLREVAASTSDPAP